MKNKDKTANSSTFRQNVTPQGRITVPKPIREALMISTGDKLDVTVFRVGKDSDQE